MKFKLLIISILAVGCTVSLAAGERNVLTGRQDIFKNYNVANENFATLTDEILIDQGFEGDVTGWTVVNNDGDQLESGGDNSWGVFLEDADSDVAHNGSYGVGVYYNAAGNDDWLITPRIGIPADAVSASFIFFAKSHDPAYLEDLNVLLSSGSKNLSDFTVTLEEIRSIPNSWTEYFYDISDYAGDSLYLAVQCVSVDKFYLFADDFYVEYSTGQTASVNAEFSADLTSGSAPLTVNFTDQSEGSVTSWTWDFGDGETSTDQNPQHIYSENGTYSVSLTVSDGINEDSITKTGFITVSDGGTPIVEDEGWFYQNPHPTAVDLNDAVVFSDGSILAVGDGGTIVKSSDIGKTWDVKKSGSGYDIYDVHLINNAVAYAVTGNGDYGTVAHVLKSIDGGDTWSVIETDHKYDLAKIHFVDENTGWITGTGGYGSDAPVYKTTDGGATWTLQTSGLDEEASALFFTDENQGWMGHEGFIAYTVDGGANWNTIEVYTEDYPYIYEIFFINNQVGWIAGSGGTGLSKTTDGGMTWSDVQISGEDSFSGVFFRDADKGYAWSDDVVYFTADGGTTWNEEVDLEGYSQYVRAVTFEGAFGAITATSGIIYASDGSSWSQVNSAYFTDKIEKIFFLDDMTGWAVGWMDNIWATTDGGSSWVEQGTEAHYTLYDIDFVDAVKGWAVGDGAYGFNSRIYHTADGGTTWTPQSSSTENILMAVDMVDSQIGWAVGWNGTILYTADGGENWTAQSSNTSLGLRDIHVESNTDIFAVGAEGAIIHTSDGGVTWNTLSSGTSENLYAIDFADASHAYIVGSSGTRLSSGDGGLTWTVDYEGGWNDPLYNDVSFSDASNGWISGNEGTLLVTDDGGLNWYPEKAGISLDIKTVVFVDANTGWFAGDNGMIMKTTNGGWVGINENPAETNLPSSVDLWQNFPNPFNPSTTISFSLSADDRVSLRVYDMKGALVMNLLEDAALKAGSYHYRINAADLPSGIYIYRISSTSANSARKMTLLK